MSELETELDAQGCAVLPTTLAADECATLTRRYDDARAWGWQGAATDVENTSTFRIRSPNASLHCAPICTERDFQGGESPLSQEAEWQLGSMAGRDILRVIVRHGVSRLRAGHRYTLGIIFPDAA